MRSKINRKAAARQTIVGPGAGASQLKKGYLKQGTPFVYKAKAFSISIMQIRRFMKRALTRNGGEDSMTKLTIIQQNDTHGSLELHPELFWKENKPELRKTGGFPKIAKYIKDLKSQNDNILFLDGGDLFHGTLPLVASKGEAILPALEKMGLDGWVPGNWDFAYGKEQLSSLVKALPFPSVACNVKD